LKLILCSALLLGLAACDNDDSPVTRGGGGGAACGPEPEGTHPSAAAVAASLVQKAQNVLPPGQSGFVSTQGQAAGMASGVPADYGEHLDDQRLLYWSFDTKDGALGGKPGTATVPKAGVEVYRDAFGVPIVYAGTVRDLWHGVGYAVAQDRLFLMDAVRRTGRGTLAELTGCGTVPADIAQRVTGYSTAEYQAMFAALPQDARDSIQGYIDGANAWRQEAIADPRKLPAEYALLTATPAEFSIEDVLAAAVYITRFVAAEGGNEFLNIRMLKELEAEYGSRAAAKAAFQDLVWLEDPRAAVSVPPSVGRFSNQAQPPRGRGAVFDELADWAMDLPETIWKGPGTGHAPIPGDCGGPLALAPGFGGAFASREVSVGKRAAAAARLDARRARAAREAIRQVVGALSQLRALLHGGSMAYALGPSRTKDRGTLLVSGPQLGYTYPSLLVEYEIHAGDYHARGTSVPILPVVGIGYTPDVAWGLTTGYSKTIDSFIEETCPAGSSECAADEYRHDGSWKPMSCRNETVSYRQSQQGAPFGPPVFRTSVKVCRTVHGPVVARDDAAGLARSLQYAMWKREADNIKAFLHWNRARGFADFMAGARELTWNENVTFATRDGHFGFIHPGLFPRRHAQTDMRLPTPGDGSRDMGPSLSFDELPKAIDPPQGFVANWNNKPALGWLDGEGMGATSRPGGRGQRVTSIQELLATRTDWTFADLRAIDRDHGTRDHRAREFRPAIAAFRAAMDAQLGGAQAALLDRVLLWDGLHYGAGIDPANAATWTDDVAATLFGAYVVALRQELFGGLADNVLDESLPSPDPNDPDPTPGLTVYGRVAGVGSHVFDQSVMDNVILRILRPESSCLAMRHDFTGGRTRDEIMLAALDRALEALAEDFNDGEPLAPADLERCRRAHPRSNVCSLTGVIGPGSSTTEGACVTMPYQDRGSWVHRVGWEAP
jgi:penicillin G amidase